MDDEILSNFEMIGRLKAFIRKPRLLESGNEIRFFVPGDSPYADLALMLGRNTLHDCEVMITLHVTKGKDGEDLSKKGTKKKTDGTPDKLYAAAAHMLYNKGFFNAPQVRAEIKGTKDVPKPDAGAAQSPFAAALAQELGYDSMGHVPPAVLMEWAVERSVEWLLPEDYRKEAGEE